MYKVLERYDMNVVPACPLLVGANSSASERPPEDEPKLNQNTERFVSQLCAVYDRDVQRTKNTEKNRAVYRYSETVFLSSLRVLRWRRLLQLHLVNAIFLGFCTVCSRLGP